LARIARHIYAIAIGSNQPRSGRLTPRRLVAKAIARLSREPFDAFAVATIRNTAPLGPSRRRYANTAMLVGSRLEPDAMLQRLQHIEHKAGRKRHKIWGARTLDLDIILWSGGCWGSETLTIPHPLFRTRDFVLDPLEQIVGDWRDPVSGRTVRQLRARLKKPLVKGKAG
jgi:2-amino-4-hydroxy-6-hydroxymethyldihydropteridine diphosphokinase